MTKGALKKAEEDSVHDNADGDADDVTVMPCLWKLPDTVLFQIVSFVAPATHRASVICHQIAILSKNATKTLLHQEDTSAALWDIILREDYGVHEHHPSSGHHADDGGGRRACKRLRRSLLQRVKSAHQLIHDNTEIAFFYLSEMVNSASGSKLSKSKLRGLLEEYGPIRVNNIVSSGGLFLVELCRARHVKESTVLSCVTELVEHYGALVNATTSESASVRERPLCVAAARGMPSVVQYLLKRGADPNRLSTGRFRLHSCPKRSVQCKNQTPLQFAQTMRKAEQEAGATNRELASLDLCIKRLQRVTRKLPPDSPAKKKTRTKR